MTMSQWIETNTRLRKQPFSFKGYEFQRQIVDDMHPNLSVKKLSQVGLTEIQIRKFLAFLKRTTAVSGIYSLPTDKMRDRVSQTRVKSLVEGEPVFNTLAAESPVRSKGLYQIDDSFGYFTGNTEGDATSIPADLLINDEVDLSNQRILGLFQSRLQGSAYRITQRLSTPTYTGYGIDALVEISDKHEYLYRCSGCGHHQIPVFHPHFLCLPGLTRDFEDLSKLTDEEIDMIDLENSYFRCEQCLRPLDLHDPSLREWVPEFPSRTARGYTVRIACVPTLPPKYIFEQLKLRRAQDDIRGFHNTVLGEAYNDGDARLSEADIRAVLGTPAQIDPDPREPVFIGMDAGLIYHVVLGTPSHAFGFLQVPYNHIVEFVSRLLRQYNVIAGCQDRNPYTPTAEEIRDIPGHVGKIMPIIYGTHGDVAPLTPNKDEFGEITHFTANRTRMIDVVAKLLRKRSYTLDGYGDMQSLLITHLRDMVRIEQPDVPPSWQKLSGNDHFFHALGYMMLAVRMKEGIDFRSDKDPRSSIILLGSNVFVDPSHPQSNRLGPAASAETGPLLTG
jgi:hypothetical protein